MDITASTLIQQRDAIADKTLSAVELTRAYLARIERHDAAIGAYYEVHADRALERAAAVDRREIAGPLAGVTLAIKANLCTDYGTTTCSSKMLEGYRSPFTATAVRRLEDAGAVVLGKTTMDEFALGSSCETAHGGGARNPWDIAHVPGGSSGGSAAAMAADLCSASLGSDTGGSVRQPAALCGVVGVKPTYGRISRYGLVACASSLDQIGPFTRTVADAALLTRVMAGHDPLDSTCSDFAVDEHLHQVDRPMKDLRLGLPKQYVLEGANDPAVDRMIEEAVKLYESLGATLVEVDLPHTAYGIPAYYIQMTAEVSSNLARYDGVHYGHRPAPHTRAGLSGNNAAPHTHAGLSAFESIVDLYEQARAEGFGDEVKRRVMLGTYVLSSGYAGQYYDKALRVRRLIRNDFDAAFLGCDAIICPTTTGPAFECGEKADDPLAMYLNDVYTVNVNLAGIAGLSLPAGTATVDGKVLPLGLQLIGPAFSEAALFRIARMYEANAGHENLRPTL